MSITVGSKAPPFNLPSKPGTPVDVGQLLGKEKVVLLFIPLAFSSVCTAAMCHFRDTWAVWQGLGCKAFAISVDSPFTVDKFRELERIPFPVLSDFNKDVSRLYGALHEELMGLKGVSKRSAFVIDATGVVRYASVSDDPKIQVDYAAIEQAVRKC
ncbi:MAG: redoxin domain-containing protein [Phycisphaerales bacterium]|nr:redoxin domain-containing protein [Phycisphaerales bacterium]